VAAAALAAESGRDIDIPSSYKDLPSDVPLTAHIFTIDVEDWFHISDLENTPTIGTWNEFESRVERNMHGLLDLLDSHDVKATCFFLGWVGERFPGLVRETASRGHEVASHGYAHELVYEISQQAFRADIRRAKAILEDCSGGQVLGYRAPGFSITPETPWAWDILAEEGYRYDSSLFAARRGFGGDPHAYPEPHVRQSNAASIVAMPLRPARALGQSLMFSGGGYLRLLPASVITFLADRLARVDAPIIYYIHPREIDPEQPRLPMPLVRTFKSYVNLSTTRSKLARLFRRYQFKRMIDWVDAHETGLPQLPSRAELTRAPL
jgi:polysaccharide deacetylase family protein (PEP-CTERM system associated)